MIYCHSLVGARDFLYVLYLGSCAKNVKIKTIDKKRSVFCIGSFSLDKCKYFFNFYLAAPWSTLGHYWKGGLSHLTLITMFLQFWPEGHQEAHYKVRSLSPAEHLWNWTENLIKIYNLLLTLKASLFSCLILLHLKLLDLNYQTVNLTKLTLVLN